MGKRFGNLGGIRTNQGGMYFEEGDYIVEIKEVLFKENRKKLDCFIVSGVVIESTCESRQPGCNPSQVVVFKDPDLIDLYLGNVKQFVAASGAPEVEHPDSYAADVDPSIPKDNVEEATNRFWEELTDMIVSDEQPLTGMHIRLNVTPKETKTPGKFFSVHTWGEIVKEA